MCVFILQFHFKYIFEKKIMPIVLTILMAKKNSSLWRAVPILCLNKVAIIKKCLRNTAIVNNQIRRKRPTNQ